VRVSSPNDVVTFDLAGKLGDTLGVLYEPADQQINANYVAANQSFAMMRGVKPARGFLIVDNYSAPNQPFEGSLSGEMMVLDFAQGAGWGYAAYNAAPLNDLDDMTAADTLYPFEDAAERSGEVLAGNRALTLTTLNGEASRSARVSIAPVAGMAPDGLATRFFVTPIGHSVTFPADTVANGTVINGQAIIGPRSQARGDLTTEVLLAVGNPNDPGNSDVFFDRDEGPVSGRFPRKVTCVGSVNAESLLTEASLSQISRSGGWSALAVRSPGPLATLSDNANPPAVTRTRYTNQAAVIKLEFSTGRTFLGQAMNNPFNNAHWLRQGIRESILAPANLIESAIPRLLIRDVVDDRGMPVDVGEDFVGDDLNLAR